MKSKSKSKIPSRIRKMAPSADEDSFQNFPLGTQPATVSPPITGTIDNGHFKPDTTAQWGKKSRKRKPKVAAVPVIEQDASFEATPSEFVNPMNRPWPGYPAPHPTYSGSFNRPHSFRAGYDGLESHDIYPTMDTTDALAVYNQYGRAGSSSGGGYTPTPPPAVRSPSALPSPEPSTPSESPTSSLAPYPGALVEPIMQHPEPFAYNPSPSRIPTIHPVRPPAHPSAYAARMQAQGHSMTQSGAAIRQSSIRHTRSDRRTVVRSDQSTFDANQTRTTRYEPYARRPPQMAPRHQVREQFNGSPTAPTYPVGPFGGAGTSNDIPALSHGGGFMYPPQGATYTPSSEISYHQPTPIRPSSWSAPTLDTSAVSQPPASPMYGEWSPTDDEDLQVHQGMMQMDHMYISGPSTSRRRM